MKRTATNSLIALAAVIVALVLAELAAGLVLNPADYLSVTLTPDPILVSSIAPGTPGFDEWGFRNPRVPSSADIVTVGDSHTYGNAAAMSEAWPSVLSRLLGMSVYNLGVGGYGPNQYYHLMTTRGLDLHPKWVLCGVYMGDDFRTAYSITYALDHWSHLRTGPRRSVNANTPKTRSRPESPGAFKELRNWLSRNSLLYRLTVHGAVFAFFKEGVRFRQAERREDPDVTSLDLPDEKIREAFRPRGLAGALDQTDPRVKEGMRLTFLLLKEMDRECRENDCTFAVVIIPTKETVFADYLSREPNLHLKGEVEQVIASERAGRQELGKFLDAAGIPYVDTLPALRRATGNEIYARTTLDMHPNGNGYKVIAETVAEFLRAASRGRS